MRTVTGIANIKDEFRKGKLICGDLRGLKNKFELTRKFGLPQLQTFFHASGGNGGERMELIAELYEEGNSDIYSTIYAFTMSDLVDQIKDETGKYEAHLVCLIWNKERTESKRRNISEFIYTNK